MIKNFETYITEGRMGRLIDSARNEDIRKQDKFNIKTLNDLEYYCKSHYKTTIGADYYIKNRNASDGMYISLDFISDQCIYLNYADDSLALQFESVESYLDAFSENLNSESLLKDYIYNHLGIDENTYKVKFRGENESFFITRKDKKPLTIEDCIIGIYDKFIADTSNDYKIIVFKND